MRVIYVKIARTGSTSILKMFSDRYILYEPGVTFEDGKFLIAHTLKEIEDNDPQLLDDTFVFTSVRNPYDRLLSAYRHLHTLRIRSFEQVLKNPPSWPEEFEWPYHPAKGEMSFAMRTRIGEYTHFSLPVSRSLMISSGVRCDMYVHLENFNNDIATLCEKLEIHVPQKISYTNRSIKNRFKWSQKTLDLAYPLIKDDIDLLGYECIKI